MSPAPTAPIQVILVSGQPTPNLTPALDPALDAREVILLTSPDMRERADGLAAVLQPAGLRVRREELPDPWDVAAMREQILTLVAAREGEPLALNATGGTKLMAIAAYEVFLSARLPIFYVHPEQDRLVWLQPEGLPPRQLANRLRLPAFLKAHGAELRQRPGAFGMAAPLKALAEALAADVDRHRHALATLNFAAASAAGTGVSAAIGAALRRKDVRALVDAFAARGLLRVEDQVLRFADEGARFFANGGWLEQYVVALAQSLKAGHPAIQDVGRGLEVVRGGGVANELDVAVLAHNRLHVIECKTRLFNEETRQGGVGAEALYKLETLLNRLGGLQARGLLVSFQPLHPRILDRARDYRIAVCAGAELAHLRERLRRWLGV